jgi:hypothetical protein
MGMSHLELSHNLADAFNALADEAQGLNDRRIVLEHKLRFAHEQVSNFFTWFCTTANPPTQHPLAPLPLCLALSATSVRSWDNQNPGAAPLRQACS